MRHVLKRGLRHTIFLVIILVTILLPSAFLNLGCLGAGDAGGGAPTINMPDGGGIGAQTTSWYDAGTFCYKEKDSTEPSYVMVTLFAYYDSSRELDINEVTDTTFEIVPPGSNSYNIQYASPCHVCQEAHDLHAILDTVEGAQAYATEYKQGARAEAQWVAVGDNSNCVYHGCETGNLYNQYTGLEETERFFNYGVDPNSGNADLSSKLPIMPALFSKSPTTRQSFITKYPVGKCTSPGTCTPVEGTVDKCREGPYKYYVEEEGLWKDGCSDTADNDNDEGCDITGCGEKPAESECKGVDACVAQDYYWDPALSNTYDPLGLTAVYDVTTGGCCYRTDNNEDGTLEYTGNPDDNQAFCGSNTHIGCPFGANLEGVNDPIGLSFRSWNNIYGCCGDDAGDLGIINESMMCVHYYGAYYERTEEAQYITEEGEVESALPEDEGDMPLDLTAGFGGFLDMSQPTGQQWHTGPTLWKWVNLQKHKGKMVYLIDNQLDVVSDGDNFAACPGHGIEGVKTIGDVPETTSCDEGICPYDVPACDDSGQCTGCKTSACSDEGKCCAIGTGTGTHAEDGTYDDENFECWTECDGGEFLSTMINNHEYVCSNFKQGEADNRLAVCCGDYINSILDFRCDENYARWGGIKKDKGDTIRAGGELLYCTAASKWVVDVDKSDTATCDAFVDKKLLEQDIVSNVDPWTSATEYYNGDNLQHCCGDDENEYYTDTGAACWNGVAIEPGELVHDGRPEAEDVECDVNEGDICSGYNVVEPNILSNATHLFGCVTGDNMTGKSRSDSLTYEDGTAVPLVTPADHCTMINITQGNTPQYYYCSYRESGSKFKWKQYRFYWPTGDEMPMMDQSISPDGSSVGCCPAGSCWDGEECIGSQISAQDEGELTETPDGKKWMCYEGEWGEAEYECDWTGDNCGYCPSMDMCFTGPEAGNTCVNIGEYYGDHICVEHSWSSRTLLVATKLENYSSQHSPDEYSIYCDTPQSALNDPTYIHDPAIAKFFEKTNNVCVMRTKDKIFFGTSLNEPIDSNLFPLIKTTHPFDVFEDYKHDCAGAIIKSGGYEECIPNSQDKLWWDNDTRLLIYVKDAAVTIEQPDAIELTMQVILNPIESMEKLISVIWGSGFEPTFSTEGNYDRVYVARKDGKSVEGAFGPKLMSVKYKGFGYDICKSIENFGFGIICQPIEEEGELVYQVAADNIAGELVWRKLTAGIRLTDYTLPAGGDVTASITGFPTGIINYDDEIKLEATESENAVSYYWDLDTSDEFNMNMKGRTVEGPVYVLFGGNMNEIAGPYTITLTVVGEGGKYAVAEQSITVNSLRECPNSLGLDDGQCENLKGLVVDQGYDKCLDMDQDGILDEEDILIYEDKFDSEC